MIPHKTKLFCITVHFGSQQATNRLIGQLEAQNSDVGGVIVVDNAQEPYITPRASLPIHITRTGDNLGYAGGIHLGLGQLHTIAVQDGDLIMCCNNDIEITENGVPRIIAWWAQQPGRLLAGAKIGYVNLLTGRTHINGSPNIFIPTMPYVHGSCLIATLATWRALGKLPDKFFMYWEDVALSTQAAGMGISLRQLPRNVIQHPDEQGHVSGKKLYYLVRNGAYVLETATPKPWPVYWRIMNTVRRILHNSLSHKEIAHALEDRKKL